MTDQERATIRAELRERRQPYEDWREIERQLEVVHKVATEHEEALRELARR